MIKEGKCFLLEPQGWAYGLRMPRITTLRYHPQVSVAWDGKKILYYDHKDRNTDPPLSKVPGLIGEYLLISTRVWIRFSYRFPLWLASRIWARFRRLRGTTNTTRHQL